MPNDNASLFRAASAWRAVVALYAAEAEDAVSDDAETPSLVARQTISHALREALNVWADDVVAARCKAGRDGCRPAPEIF